MLQSQFPILLSDIIKYLYWQFLYHFYFYCLVFFYILMWSGICFHISLTKFRKKPSLSFSDFTFVNFCYSPPFLFFFIFFYFHLHILIMHFTSFIHFEKYFYTTLQLFYSVSPKRSHLYDFFILQF